MEQNVINVVRMLTRIEDDIPAVENSAKTFELLQKHGLLYLVTAKKAVNLGFEIEKQKLIKEERSTALMRMVYQDDALEKICGLFNKNDISYAILKGKTVSKYYPEPWMRRSLDIDVLIKEKDIKKAKKVLIENGFIFKRSGLHDISFVYNKIVVLELHFTLIEDGRIEDNSILKNVWKYVEHVSENQYRLSDEMLYFYQIAHAAKHAVSGGIGILMISDIYFLNKHGINHLTSEELLAKSNLIRFAENLENLAEAWFGNENREYLEELEKFVIESGEYGKEENRKLTYNLYNKRSKWSFIFPKFDYMRRAFPILENAKFLLPIMWLVRIVKIIVSPKNKDYAERMRGMMNSSKEDEIRMRGFIKEIGL